MPDLAHLREVAEAATPGRWWSAPNDDGIFAHVPDGRPNGEGIAQAVYYGKRSSPENARHIATFDPPTVLKMIAALETMEALVSSAELGILGLHVGPLKAGIWKDARKDLAALAEEGQ